MAPRPRPHRLTVKLTAAEHDALERRARAQGVPKAEILRAAITTPAEDRPPPTRARVLAQLAEAAECGSVAAMTTLERALRLAPAPPMLAPGRVGLDALDALDGDDDAPSLRVVQ